MWPKSMHDQKFGTFYSLRPEDGLYGSNEPKKMRNPPGSFLNRAFQSFQVLFYIYYRYRLSLWLFEAGSVQISTICLSFNGQVSKAII